MSNENTNYLLSIAKKLNLEPAALLATSTVLSAIAQLDVSLKSSKKETLESVSEKLNIEPALLLAAKKIESNGRGFTQGKVTVLFERHIFYKQLKKAGFDVETLSAQHPKLINSKAGGYIGGTQENYRLAMAKQINEACAIESASFGLFQIMGFHWKALGYESPQHYEAEMSESEQKQTEAFIRFLTLPANKKMFEALQSKDFATFARLYNGPAYKKNRYDEKLKEAYDGFTQAL